MCDKHWTIEKIKQYKKYRLLLPVLFLVLLLSSFIDIKPAEALPKVCHGPKWTSTNRTIAGLNQYCMDVPNNSVIFPPGTTAPIPCGVLNPGGACVPWNTVIGYPIPQANATTTFSNTLFCQWNWNNNNCAGYTANNPLRAVLPITPNTIVPRPPDPYGPGPYWGIDLPTEGWKPKNTLDNLPPTPGLPPIWVVDPFQAGTPIIVPPGADPYGIDVLPPQNNWLWNNNNWNNNNNTCSTNQATKCIVKKPFSYRYTDPILFLPTGEAMMVPLGTVLVRPSAPVSPGGTTTAGQFLPLTMMGDTTGAGNAAYNGVLQEWQNLVPGFQPYPPAIIANANARRNSIDLSSIFIQPGDILLPPPPSRQTLANGTPFGPTLPEYTNGPLQFTAGYATIPWTLSEISTLSQTWIDPTLIVPPDTSVDPTITTPGTAPGPHSSFLPPECNVADLLVGAIAGGSFSVDVCIPTAVKLGIAYVNNFQGGEQFRNKMNTWYSSKFEPAMKDMTEQLNVSVVDQSRTIGSFYDAETQTKTQGLIQRQEIESTRRLHPSENMCSMATITTGMQVALQTNRVVKDAMNQEAASRALNLPGSGTERGAVAYQNLRWSEYCTVSANTTDNAGFSGCGATGAIPGADVNVERFLFQDTIDMANQNERMAANAILVNLVDPRALEPLPANFNTTLAKRTKLKRDHYAALRQPLTDVVSGIIARRTSIPNGELGAGVGIAVFDIRDQAGIPIGERTMSPSYNEMMLARSKEYFFNVDKVLQTGSNIGAIRQELVTNESLIAVTLQDIEELERQINAVLMTQASIKLNADENKSTTNMMKKAPRRR